LPPDENHHFSRLRKHLFYSNTSSLGFSRVVNECEIEAIRVISIWHVKGRFGAKEFSESIPKRPALKVILQWASPIVSGSWRCKN